MPAPDIAALIDDVMDGDVDAYGGLVSRYQAEVWSVVAAMLLDRGDAEDLVQLVFVRAYQQLDRYERGRDFGVWLKTIARNLVRNELRRRGRELNRLTHYYDELQLQLADGAAFEERRAELVTALDRCLAALPEPAYHVVRLRYEQGLEFDEIAGALERTVPAARQLLSRARLWLRDCVKKELPQP